MTTATPATRPAAEGHEDLDQVAVWHLAGHQRPGIEVRLYEATDQAQAWHPPRAATVAFGPPTSLERVSDPAALLAAARLLETVAGWVSVGDTATPPDDLHAPPVPAPTTLTEYDETQ